MSNVIADLSMSLDGYITGLDPDLEHGLGRGGEAIQQWVFAPHESPRRPRHTERFTFVTEGTESAVSEARRVADEKPVVVMGGAEVKARAISAGLVDRIRIHLSPVLMGDGTSLFELIDKKIQLTQVDAVTTLNATHLTYEVGRDGRTQE